MSIISSLENLSSKNHRQFKGTVLLDVFLAPGHINAFQLLAQWLFKNGYRVVFIGAPFERVINDKFEFYRINSFLFEPNRYEVKQKGFLRCLLDNIYESKYKRSLPFFQKVASDYDKLIAEVSPDLILLDDHYAYKALFYQRYKIDIISISTMTLPLMSAKIPPFQTAYIPDNTKVSNLTIKYLQLKIRIKRLVKGLVFKICCHGVSDSGLMKRLCPGSTFTFDTNRYFGIGISEIPMVAVYPKAFDFDNDFSSKNIFHFGRLPNQMPLKIEDSRLISIIDRVKRENLHRNDRYLVYCSLGTITMEYLRVCHTFFRKIVAIASLNPTAEFILSVGEGYDISQLGKTPANLSVFSFVPQIELLKHVDIMINHGGLNSVKECIEENVPMISCPLSPNWDQPGCAARIVYHKLGLMGNIRKDSIRKINSKILSLISNLKWYRQNLSEFKKKVEVDNAIQESKILSLINESVNQRRLTNFFFNDDSLPTKTKQNSC